MKKYTVTFTLTYSGEMEVEALDAEEALDTIYGTADSELVKHLKKEPRIRASHAEER